MRKRLLCPLWKFITWELQPFENSTVNQHKLHINFLYQKFLLGKGIAELTAMLISESDGKGVNTWTQTNGVKDYWKCSVPEGMTLVRN